MRWKQVLKANYAQTIFVFVAFVSMILTGCFAVGNFIKIAFGLALMVVLNALLLKLSAAKMDSDEENKAKSAFLATMSHEIRTPMNAILGLTEVQLCNPELPKSTEEDLERIYRSGTTLLGIINDILDLSKIETGNLELKSEEYNFPCLINDVIQLNVVRIGTKPIKFRLEIDENLPLNLIGDELRLRQVLNNLMSNAFKYTDSGDVILSVTQRKNKSDTMLVFAVSDTGQGIRPEDLKNLFKEYQRLNENKNSSIEGTGLGLSISNRLVGLMGGTIEVESEFGFGSTFTVTILQQPAGDAVLGSKVCGRLRSFNFSELRTEDSKKPEHHYMPYGRILIVDDIETNIHVAKGLLKPYGVRIDAALSGFDAIDMVNQDEQVYDLVLMDHMMPKMDGIETVRKIRNLKRGYAKTLPIVALTANAVSGIADMFLSNGFDGFISKPIDMRQIDIVLEQYIYDKATDEQRAEARQARLSIAPMVKEEPAPLPEIDGVDVAQGVSMIGGSEEMYLTMLGTFCKEADERLDILQRVPSEDEIVLFVTTVHALKSALANVGVPELSAAAADLENAGKNSDMDFIAENLASFREKIVVIIGNVRGALPAPEEPADSISVLDDDMLANLKTAVEAEDSVAADDILDVLMKQPYDAKIKEMLTAVSDAVLMYDFDEAVKIIDDLQTS